MIKNPFLEARTILVTGAGSGIGLGTAKLFADLGAKLFLADVSEAALDAAIDATGAVSGAIADVTDETACEAMVAAAEKAFGPLQGVFNSAGVSDAVSPALDIDIDGWQRIVDINLRGTFLVARAAARVMIPRRQGSIVTISSVNGVSGIPRRHAYGPAKAAIAQLTRTLACEWGDKGVRINSLAPGYINTPMVTRLKGEGKVDIARLENRTPLARLGEIEEVARTAAFLLSDWASYITGAIVPVDGGWTAYGGPGDVRTA